MRVCVLADPSRWARAFVSCPLGAEIDLESELHEIRGLLLSAAATPFVKVWKTRVLKGGVEVEADLIAIFQINYWSRIAHRVLLRVAEFHAQSLPRLQARLREAAQASPYWQQRPVSFSVEAQSCVVNNEKTIARLCEESWRMKSPQVAGAEGESEIRVFVRGVGNDWTVSLDTTGTHLHQRGDRPDPGLAPIRENLAALTLRRLAAGCARGDLAQVSLVDPMAGTGTFLREGRQFFLPHRSREFAFQKFAGLPKLLLSPSFWANYKNHPLFALANPFAHLLGIDREIELSSHEHNADLATIKGDYRKIDVRQHLGLGKDQPLWIVCNPPYGERLSDMSWLEGFWKWAGMQKPERMAIWMLRKRRKDLLKGGPDPKASWPLKNGGLDCELLLF